MFSINRRKENTVVSLIRLNIHFSAKQCAVLHHRLSFRSRAILTSAQYTPNCRRNSLLYLQHFQCRSLTSPSQHLKALPPAFSTPNDPLTNATRFRHRIYRNRYLLTDHSHNQFNFYVQWKASKDSVLLLYPICTVSLLVSLVS